MGNVSGRKKYIPKTFERGIILNSIQEIFKITGVDYDELNISARFIYEGGITENRDLSLEEVKDICYIDKQPEHLFFYSKNLSIIFTRIFTDQILVTTSSNTREIVKLAFDILEEQLSLQEQQCKIEPKTEISEDLIRELLKDGERLVNQDDDHENAITSNRRKTMNNKIKPELKPQLVNYEMFSDYTPEKLELFDGILLGDIEDSKKLLLLLLYNIGLEETVKLAPKELWKQAINSLTDLMG